MTLSIGQTVAGFEITAHIGSGGMGDVFRARDTKLGRDVAIKLVSAEVAARPSRLERLRREARLLAALSHPSIAAIHGLEEVDGVPLLILELIEGPTLQERIRSGPPFGTVEALKIAAQIASGVGAAHAKGIIHRDLKPGNIKLQPDGRIKLLDFGIAKNLDPQADEERDDQTDETTVDMTVDGAVFGTAPYMSPEQVRGTGVTRATDVWAFGCVLFEVLSGRKAFGNVAAVLENDPDWTRLPADTPREVRDLIRRCTHKDAARRPPQLSDVATTLDEIAVAMAAGLAPARFADARRWIYAGVAAAAGVAIVIGVMGLPSSEVVTAPQDARVAPAAGQRSAVAVMTLRNLSNRDEARWIGTALSETMSADLRAGDVIRVIPGERVAIMQRELELLETEAFTSNTLNRMRGVIGCDYVVTGSYLVSANRVRADIRVQDARTGELIATVSESGVTDDLIDLTSKLGSRLRPALGLAINDAGRSTMRVAIPENPEVARLYTAALARLRDLDPLGARPLLEQAARLEPAAPLVHHALARTWSALGYRGRAAASAKAAFEHAASLPWERRLEIEARHAESSRELPKAVALYQQLADRSPDDVEIALQLAAAQRGAGQPKDALATLQRLRRLPPPLSDDPRIDLESAAAWQAIGNAVSVLDAAQRAVTRADATGSRYLLAKAYLSLASGQLLNADYPAARAAARESQRIGEGIGDKSTVAASLRTVGVACWYLSDPDCMVRNSEQSMLIAKEIGERHLEATALGNMAIGEILLGRTESALKHELEALAIRTEIDDRAALSTSHHNLGELYQALGRLDDAERSYREELGIAQRHGEGAPIAAAHSGLGDVMAARDRMPDARKHFDQSMTIRSELKLNGLLAATELAYGTALVQSGAAEDAEPLLSAAVNRFRAVKDRDREAWAIGFLARAQAAQGALDRARATIDGGLAAGERAAYFRARLTFGVNRAVIQAASGMPGDVEAARRSLEALLAEATSNGMINRQLEVRLELGRVELMTPSTASAGRERLRALIADARARGYAAIARHAAGALAT